LFSVTVFTAGRVCIARTMPWQDICLSVRHTPVFCISSKFFHRRVAPPFFPHQTGWQYSNGNPPPNGGVECKGYEKSRLLTSISSLSRKWCKTEPWKANTKPHPSFRMLPVWMTSSDLWSRFQGHDYSTLNNSTIVQHTLTMADQQKVVYDLSNGAIFNDPEGHDVRWISQKRYNLQT